MSDDTEKPGVVIDVTPEPATELPQEETEESEPAGKKPNRSSWLPLGIAVIALALVGVSLFLTYRSTQQSTQDLARINARLSQSLAQQQTLEKQLGEAEKAVSEQARHLLAQQQKVEQQEKILSEAQQQFQQQEKLLDRERQSMQEREAELRASVADVHKRVGASGNQWMASEAEYLIRLANERLTLARDIATAREALLLADQRLRDTGDPGWNTVRRQIARDIARLDRTNVPDTVGISARLSSLAEQVPQLRLARAALGGMAPSPAEQAKSSDRSERSWDTLLDDLWAGFKSTVRIRRNDQPIQAMLPPEQQYFLYENLRLHLESARLAVARADDALYHDSLNTVSGWLDSYFDPGDQLTRSMSKRVRELDKIDIRPSLPDISQSLRAFELRQKLNKDLARPIAPAEEPVTPAAEPAQ